MAITPNREQFLELAQAPDEGPVTMLNLLRFKDKAEGEEGSGRDAYNRYGDSVIKMVEAQGGKMLWMGRADQVLIGDPDADRWHAVALVQYPSRKAFIEMVTTPEYNDAHKHRESGLDSTVLIAMTQTGP
ncbi:MAG TPA: DUF1330 domain-containing protein [Acidimicrobiales bacterium]|nr:DUF1330 domain-containing protein [Acidimicrobiales bacterium]